MDGQAVFCRACETSLARTAPMMETACPSCGWPTGIKLEKPNSSEDQALPESSFSCPRCAGRKTPLAYDRVTPLYRYQDTVTAVVVAAKYPRNSAITRELACRLAVRCLERWPDLSRKVQQWPPIVTSVPSPWLRQTRRGGSGTQLLGQYFAAELGVPYRHLLKTTRSIAKQAWLDDESRVQNVRDAFAIRRQWPRLGASPRKWPVLLAPKDIQGRNIILVDDVITTGATANEVTHVLLDAGAKSVSIAAVAVAIRDR